MRSCSHTPNGEMRAHLEIWRTEEGWAVIAFARPEVDPQCVAECGALQPALEVAVETVLPVVNEMDELLTEEAA